MTEMIHILGSGSIGMLWASRLSLAGKQVHLIPRHSQSIQTETFKLSTTINKKTVDCKNILVGAVDATKAISILLVCTKAYDALKACQELTNNLTPDTHIVLLQNGMGFQSDILNTFTEQKIFIGISTEGAMKHNPYHVSHTGIGQTYIGAASSKETSFNDSWLKQIECGLSVEATNNITPLQWQKVAINSIINPLSTLYDCKNGDLLNIEAARKEMQTAIDELLHLATAMKMDEVFVNIDIMIHEVIKATENNSSSMREDVRQHRRTEIEFINGFIIQQAHKHGLILPTHQKLLNYIQQQPYF